MPMPPRASAVRIASRNRRVAAHDGDHPAEVGRPGHLRLDRRRGRILHEEERDQRQGEQHSGAHEQQGVVQRPRQPGGRKNEADHRTRPDARDAREYRSQGDEPRPRRGAEAPAEVVQPGDARDAVHEPEGQVQGEERRQCRGRRTGAPGGEPPGPTSRATDRLTVAGMVTADFRRVRPARRFAAKSCGRSQPPVAMVEARPMSGAELVSVARNEGITVVWLVKLAPMPKKNMSPGCPRMCALLPRAAACGSSRQSSAFNCSLSSCGPRRYTDQHRRRRPVRHPRFSRSASSRDPPPFGRADRVCQHPDAPAPGRGTRRARRNGTGFAVPAGRGRGTADPRTIGAATGACHREARRHESLGAGRRRARCPWTA